MDATIRKAIGHRSLTPDRAGAGTSDDTANNTAGAKNLVLSSASVRSGPRPEIDRQRAAAGRIGVSVDEYRRHKQDGDRWCSRHRGWLPADRFRSQTQSYCAPCVRAYMRARRAS